MTEMTTADLHTLAADVRDAHEQVFAGVEHSLTHVKLCGELFLQAKNAVPHGEWGDWIERNCDMSLRSAQAYMRIASNWDKIEAAKAQSIAHLDGVVSCLALLNDPGADNEKQSAGPLVKNGDGKNTAIESAGPSQPDIPNGGTVTVESSGGETTEIAPQEMPVAQRPAVSTDKVGVAVPKKFLEIWKAGHDIELIARSVTQAASAIAKISDTPAGVLLETNSIDIALKNSASLIRSAKYHTVCPYCQGKSTKVSIYKCECCKGVGWIRKITYGQLPNDRKQG